MDNKFKMKMKIIPGIILLGNNNHPTITLWEDGTKRVDKTIDLITPKQED